MNRNAPWTVLKVLEWTTGYFERSGVDAPRLAAEVLLAHVLDTTRLDLYLRFDQPLQDSELAEYRAIIKRRAAREPLAYVTGKREFWSLDLGVCPDVLIPRPETEGVVEAAINLLPRAGEADARRVADLGTGSGAILLALATERPGHRYLGVDRCEKALAMANENAARLGLAGEVEFVRGDWFSALAGEPPLDLVVSNPPYIRTTDLDGLAPEVRDHEPLTALDGGVDGLDAYRAIIPQAARHLAHDGALVLEIGWDQRDGIAKITDRCGHWRPPEIIPDLAGHDRIAILRRK
ncbi:MAG: peptide chain release factor N(5)-glutamine methyltransferase [Desulfatibacillaceae bacterium]